MDVLALVPPGLHRHCLLPLLYGQQATVVSSISPDESNFLAHINA